MGGADSEDKDAISEALGLAWEEWSKDVTGVVQERNTATSEKGSGDQSDFEDNRKDLENDRKVASDDDGDNIDEGSLMVETIWDIELLDDAGTARLYKVLQHA